MMLCVDSASVASPAVFPVADPRPAAEYAGAPACGAWTARPGAAVPALLSAAPEHAASRRPVPTVADPAMRSVRAAGWRARAPMARNERLMHFRRAGAANGFARHEMNARRYRCGAYGADARMCGVSYPRIEPHVHLEGTVRPAALLQIARRNGVALPADSVSELAAIYEFRDFPHFLDVWWLTSGALRFARDFRQVVFDYAAEAASHGAVYLEGIFSPSEPA